MSEIGKATEATLNTLKTSGDDKWISLGYLLEKITTDVDEVKKKVNDNLYVTREDHNKDMTVLNDRIVSLEDDRKWLIRTVAGLLISGILAALYIGGK